jgi:outer membrane autotransporter protein
VALDALSGEIHASAVSAIVDEARYLRDAVAGRWHQGNEGSAGMWLQPLGARGDLEGDGNAVSLARSTAGVFGGLDATFNSDWRLGVAGGYTQSWFDADELSSSGSSNNYHLAVFGSRRFGALGLRLGAARSWQQLKIARDVFYSGFADSESAEYTARTTQLFGELAYGIALGRSALEPFAGLAYVNVDSDGFVEQGGAAALTGSSRFDAPIATLGLRGSAPLMTGDRIQLSLRGGLGWRHAFGDLAPKSTLGFVAGGEPFVARGVPIAKDALAVQAGIDVDIAPNAKLSVLYDGELAATGSDNAARVGLSLRF